MGNANSESADKAAPKAAAKAEANAPAEAAAAPPAAAAAPAAAETPAGEHPEKKRMSVMSKHLKEHMGESEEHTKQWMAHFGVNAEGDIVNKKKHDAACAGFVGAVDGEGNLVDKDKFAAACEQIKAKGAKKEKSAGKGKGKQQAGKGCKICVRNLSEDAKEEKLKELFQSFGTITKVDLKSKDDGKCKGFGFVAFSSAEEASKAMADMNDKQVDGKKLAVTLAFDSQEKGADAKGQGKGKDGKGAEKGKGKVRGNQSQNQAQAQATMQAYQAQVQGWYALQMHANMMAQWQYAQMQGYYGQGMTAPMAAAAAMPTVGDIKQYDGVIKRVTARNAYGFISCDELKGKWKDDKNPEGRDIYIGAELIPESCKQPGAKVKFTLTFNAKGHPQASSCIPA